MYRVRRGEGDERSWIGKGGGGVIRWFRGERGMGGVGAGSGERIAIFSLIFVQIEKLSNN